MKKLFAVLFACSLLLLAAGCIRFQNGRMVWKESNSGGRPMYIYGNSSFDAQLETGNNPEKLGMIATDQVPSSFPRQYLEADGSYGGSHVYGSIEEAEFAVIDARNKGIIPPDEQGGIYVLEGDWDSYTYQMKPKDYRLRKSAKVVKRVK